MPARQAFLLAAVAFASASIYMPTVCLRVLNSPIALGTGPRFLPYTAGDLRLLALCARPGDGSHNIADIAVCLAMVTPSKTLNRFKLMSVENFLGRELEPTFITDISSADK
jgi:hypothetical protein